MDVLDGIAKLQCKNTCKVAGGNSLAGNTHECLALKCIKEKGFEGCWQCQKFKECDKLTFLKNSYGYVIEENFSIIKEKGLSEVMPPENKYYTWQRNK